MIKESEISSSEDNTESEKGEVKIVSYEDSFLKPRFIGVPKDDQLLEKSSREGILNGKRISEVYQQDTKELTDVGFSWEQAVHVLSCLAVASECLRDDYYSKKSNVHETDISGFPKASIKMTTSKFQFDNPIADAGFRGDPKNSLELVADDSSEARLKFRTSAGEEIVVDINPQILYFATAHHLLEKGNRYALTGNQLAELVKCFDEEEFQREYGSYIEEKARGMKYGLEVIPTHKERVEFSDGLEIKLSVGRFSSMFIDTNSRDLPRLQFHLKNGKTKVDITTPSEFIGCRKEGDNLEIEQMSRDTWQTTEAETSLGEFSFRNYAETAERLFEIAKHRPNGILEGEAISLHDLIKSKIKNLRPVD